MAPIAFTNNYTDHSNAQGYQFEFHCDKCRNGFRSSYAANTLGLATGLLSAASDLFGGALGGAARAGEHMKDVLRGKAWDAAFSAAIAEIKPLFHQCARCGLWVCPEVCWNPKAAQCQACAPSLQQEAASAQAQAAKSQLLEKAMAADLTGGVDFNAPQAAGGCPHCGARAEGGKFCGSCGKSLSGKVCCRACKAELAPHTKFCGECGAQA